MELVPIFQYKPVPPITYGWMWMPLQEVNISIGTQIRSGSTMINTHWHAKIDAQQLFYFMILSVERILIDLAVSIKGTWQRYPQNFYICQEPWKYPSYRGGAHWLKYQSVHSCYSFAGKWSRKTRQIRTPVLRIPPAVTSQVKMKNWLHECQKWVSHMIGQYAHI